MKKKKELEQKLCFQLFMHPGGKYRKRISGLPGERTKSILTDGQKERCNKSLIRIACGLQARAAQAYHAQNLGPSIWLILI